MPITVGGQTYSDDQVREFYAGGGDDNQFAQMAGLTDPDARRAAILEARSLAGNAYSGEAGVQQQFNLYKQYNPNGADVNNYQNWVANQAPNRLDAMRSGTFTGSAASAADWAPGGIYTVGTGHDFSYDQSRNEMGAHGVNDGWNAWTGKYGETGGVQTTTSADWGGSGNTVRPSTPSNGGYINTQTAVNPFANVPPTNNGSAVFETKGSTPQLGYNLSQIQGATNWNVDPRTQTVAGQLETILANDSPLLQQARTRAAQTMQQRGLNNSTMALSAADSAMYDTALQIATPDAATYADAGRINAGAANEFARDGNAFTRQGVMADFNVRANEWAAQQDFGRNSMRDATLNSYQTARDGTLNGYQTSRDATLNGYQTGRDATLNGYQTDRDAVQNTNSINLAEIQARQTGANSTQAFQNQQTAAARDQIANSRAEFAAKVAAIAANTTMDDPARQGAIATLKTNYNVIITMAATQLGWQPSDWIIRDSSDV